MRAQHWMETHEWVLAVTAKRGAGLLEKRGRHRHYIVEVVVVVVVVEN